MVGGGLRAAANLIFKNMKVIFLKSGAGIGFGYHAGEEAELSDVQSKELIETGYAEEIKKAVEDKPKEVKKAVKK